MRKKFDYGSVLIYDGSRYIYAMPGNDDATYRYDTCNGEGSCTPEWTQLANAEFGNPNTIDGQKTYEGADAIYDGRNNMYVMQGNYYPYFAKYSIADDEGHGENQNTWTSLAAAPVGFYGGGSLAFDGDHTIYALVGNSRMKFMKYDINTNAWSFLSDAPATISYGASISFYNGYLYINRGGTYATFYRYNTIDNTWEIPNHNFFGNNNVVGTVYFPYSNGASMADDGSGNIYIVRGGFDNAFGKYNSSTGVFTSLSKLPMGAGNGANILYNGTENAIYYVTGNTIRTRRTGTDSQSPYFYKYSISTNSWSEITSDRPLAQIWLGSSMAYDGSRYIYLTQGNGTVTWWRYDTQGTAGSRWSVMSTVGSCASGDGSKIIYVGGTIFRTQGGNSTTNCKFSGGTWSTLGVLPGAASSGSGLIDGKDGYIYLTRGNNTNNYYRYSVSQAAPGSWENLSSANVPAQVTTGGWGVNANNRNWFTSGSGGGTTFPDGLYSYVVGSSASGTGFVKTGTYTSETIDLLQAYRFANLTANYILPQNTSLEIQTRTSSDGSIWGSWSTVSEDHAVGDKHAFSINSIPAEYIQIKAIFSSSDQIYSPRLDDLTINYYQDITAPANPTVVSAYGASDKISLLTDSTWYNYSTPYFEWPVAETSGGAFDNNGGSGVAGYYVCFALAADCTDPFVDGTFQVENSFTAPLLAEANSGKTFFLKIKAVDNAGMIPADSYTAFAYDFDNVAPTNPTDISVNPLGYSSTDTYTFTWLSDAADGGSGLKKFQYRTGGDVEGVWYDILDPATVSQTTGPYQSNKNTFYLRAVDNAGNVSAAISEDYYWSGGAASPPEDLAVVPADEENTDNSFTFTWDLPTSFAGEEAKLKYYYSVNVLPTAYNTVETTARAAGPGPFATQYGKNTFYVVALNDGGVKTNPTDIDWDNPAKVDFYAKTTAPGAPINTAIFDTSDRENQEYSVAVKWSVPESLAAENFAGYVIYRSLDDITYAEVATTTGTAYVDSELESRLYYYYVKSKDKTNNYSIASTAVSITPTGRYTSPPTIVSLPKLTIQSYAMTAIWSTNRVASSFVEFGKSVALGETNGQVDSVTDHSVAVTGLSAGSKYYYRVKFIDPDGNIGTSEIDNFTTLPPPVISEVTISDILLNSAVVSWQTNTSATCTLKSGSNSIEESSGGSNHIQKITGLQPTTTYAIRISCLDDDLNSFSSDEYSFSTPEKPVASEITVQNKDNVDEPTVIVGYKTNVPTSTIVYYRSDSTPNSRENISNELSTEHQIEISGLDPKVEYILTITGEDANGISLDPVEQKITTRSDSRPPKIITNRAIGRVIGRGSASQANIYIKVETDEITSVKARYSSGVTSNLEQATAEDPFNTYHMITIPAEPGQVYSYQADAYDAAGNLTKSEIVTVIVENAKANATEVIAGTFANRFGWLSNLWNRQATQ